MTRSFILLAPLACVAAMAALFACEDSTPPIPCRDIPPGGCPASGADACSDPVCLNVFACVGGEWKFDHACSMDAGTDAALDARSGFAFDAAIDAPPGAFGGPGCPELEMPDCPAGTAIACSNGSCCGCADLFVCRDAGWDPWGSCSADAGVQPLTTP